MSNTDNQQQQQNQGYEAPAPGILFAYGSRVSSAQAQPTDGKGTSLTAIEVHPTKAMEWLANGWTRFDLGGDAAREFTRDRELVTMIVTPVAYQQAVACLTSGQQQGSLVNTTGEPMTAGAGKQPISSGANTS